MWPSMPRWTVVTMSSALAILQEELLARCALEIGTDIDTLTSELTGPMTPTTARRLSAMLDTSPDVWTRLVNGGDDDA